MSIEADWDTIDWTLVQSRVSRHQHRIYKASIKKDHGKMHRLQKLLTRSISARLLAIKNVTTENQGKPTTGVDGITITSSAQKLELAKKLGLYGKNIKIRKVSINKPVKKEKHLLFFPVMEDRANQALAKMALEPQWEALFEPNSYGFRFGRNVQDAIEAIFLTFRFGKTYVLNADISQCFDTIDHELLLTKINTYPEMKLQISRWLKAGIMHSDKQKIIIFEESIFGTLQKSIISPLLVNIALHGMEKAINREFSTNRLRASVIRYANDFVIIHKHRETVKKIQNFSFNWLSSMGLSLNLSKTHLVASTEGFEFLGFHVIHVGKQGKLKTKVTPSKASQKKFLANVRTQVQILKGTATYVLIKRLSPIIIKWGNYFRTSECADTFTKMDHCIYQILRSWVFRRHPTWGRMKIKEKYFPEGKNWKYEGRTYNNNWVLSETLSKTSGEVKVLYLNKLAWIASKKHVKVQKARSPFDGDFIYWSQRLSNYAPLVKTTTK